MEYRNLGQSGLKVSAVGLGCNNFGMLMDQQQTNAVVSTALDQGITLFDTADVYGGQGKSESFLGKALGKKRDQAVIATKFGNPMGDGPYKTGASRRYIMQAAEASLKRLKTDYIDLYQIHKPDPETPIEETLRAMDDLVRDGKVRHIGCSNFNSWQLVEAQWLSKTSASECFVSAQNRYSLLSREIELDLASAAEKYGVGILPFFPLESGLLTGKYQTGKPPKKGTRWHAWKERGALANAFWSEERFEQVNKLQAVCDSHGHSLLELAFGWLLDRPYVSSVIAGATKPTQIKSNVKAAEFRPSPEEKLSIDEITRPFASGGMPGR
ncbi:MAG: aldo/keto reductase [Rhodospirillaceae bacterium]|jgi:aryl-alcohol dehydrogenase-like predicted oxidoreductase|nr:aldo/keto reductase [Rhodospirillaceae bacterium]MBT5241830.1 aldo/keto reductase [Rhodospirillaceae bacterium]MBT5566658.1 aldo/keto reductase [Rhodospirillaceae bacterium]MBT6087976.1 aldo/keto reductase [Rhodospirillaceae bacterium]MBT6961527.1 aldo/keto reductase [Rhodospirillaceae bacterium]